MILIPRNGEEFRNFVSILNDPFLGLDTFGPTFVTSRNNVAPKRAALNYSILARALDAWGKLSRVILRRSVSRYFWRSPELTHFLRFSLVLSQAPPRDARPRKDRGAATFVRRSRSADCKSAVASPKNRMTMERYRFCTRNVADRR